MGAFFVLGAFAALVIIVIANAPTLHTYTPGQPIDPLTSHIGAGVEHIELVTGRTVDHHRFLGFTDGGYATLLADLDDGRTVVCGTHVYLADSAAQIGSDVAITDESSYQRAIWDYEGF